MTALLKLKLRAKGEASLFLLLPTDVGLQRAVIGQGEGHVFTIHFDEGLLVEVSYVSKL